MILPPAEHTAPGAFRNRRVDNRLHGEMLAKVQRFRGRIYLQDGAIARKELTVDGRHRSPIDEQSWHVVSLDDHGQVCACLRFLEETHVRSFDAMWVRHAAAARSENGLSFRRAVERESAEARDAGVRFGEVGGWAVAESHRKTVEPLRIILATYGLLELLGSCVGVATATWRHSSAAILRRIGLTPLSVDGAALAPYHDPQYDCAMEVLRFDSREPNPKYQESVRELAVCMATAPVVCCASRRAILPGALLGFEAPMAEPALA